MNIRWEYKQVTETERGGKDVLVNFSHLGKEAGCDLPDSTPVYLDNLYRPLGLAEIPALYEYTTKGLYEPLENDPTVLHITKEIDSTGKLKSVIERKGLRVMEFGKQFCNVCVVSHDKKGL